MSRRATTKDELFLLKLYELAQKQGDPFAEIPKLSVGRAIGQNDKGTGVITNTLAQTNFIKKVDENNIYLTEHGLWLVKRLLEER